MVQVLKNKKIELENKLKLQKISEKDVEEVQKKVNEYLNQLMQEKEAFYENQKVVITAQIEIVDEIINEIISQE